MQRFGTNAVLFFILASLSTVTVVRACFCPWKPWSEDLACSAGAGFIGRVVSVFDNCPNGPCRKYKDQEDGIITYVVNVMRVLSGGKIEDNVAFMQTATNPEICGTSLTLNSVYYFFAGTPNPSSPNPVTTFYVSACTPTYRPQELNSTEKRFSKNLSKNCDWTIG